jgi:hypothetical protein
VFLSNIRFTEKNDEKIKILIFIDLLEEINKASTIQSRLYIYDEQAFKGLTLVCYNHFFGCVKVATVYFYQIGAI